MDNQTFDLKEVSGARQASRVRCVTFGADCVKVEPKYRLVDIGQQRTWAGDDRRLWIII